LEEAPDISQEPNGSILKNQSAVTSTIKTEAAGFSEQTTSNYTQHYNPEDFVL
jgi:hypothetical protein